MEIKMVSRGSEVELLLIGRLDANTSPEAGEVFEQVGDRFQSVVLNMAQLEYISSAGLRVLKLLHMQMYKKGGSLALKNVTRMVMEVFEMTGFAGLLRFI